jgi:hypothetical protein
MESVNVPTLFIVGGNDNVVLKLNRDANLRMRTKIELKVILGAIPLRDTYRRSPITLFEVKKATALKPSLLKVLKNS